MNGITLEGVSVWQGKSKILHHLHCKLEMGEFILLTGDTGSGKSTLFQFLSGIKPMTFEGQCYLLGKDISLMTPVQRATIAGTVFQKAYRQFTMKNLRSELTFTLENLGYGYEKIQERIHQVTIDTVTQHLLDRPFVQLSGGERQMVAIASAMMLGQKIILLDEPSANLDYHNTYVFRAMVEKLKQEGYTVLIADHRFYYLSGLISRVFLFDDGKMQIFNSEELFKKSNYDTRSFDLFAMDIPFQIPSEKKEKVLSLVGVSYKDILQDISLDFFTNEVTAIVGTNGVGKTTLARLLCKSIPCTHGEINGKMPFYIMQDADYQLFGTSVQAELEIADHKISQKDIRNVMDYLQLTKYADTHPFSLSGGQKQRIQVALGILSNRKVIIFDEPTSGLDLISMHRVAKEIQELKKKACVIVISHDYEFIRYISNRVVYLKDKTVKKDISLDAEHLSEFNQIFIEMRDES